MSLPGNGIFVLRGEISTLITAIKRGARWNSSNYQVGNSVKIEVKKKNKENAHICSVINPIELDSLRAFIEFAIEMIKKKSPVKCCYSLFYFEIFVFFLPLTHHFAGRRTRWSNEAIFRIENTFNQH